MPLISIHLGNVNLLPTLGLRGVITANLDLLTRSANCIQILLDTRRPLLAVGDRI